ncbi:hypothetical protein BGZ49_002561 [Haplosporangium sp. Z 27]|nr:hypothetical protein BGZ49_002561 [Haplosporangium sp. Z 27]
MTDSKLYSESTKIRYSIPYNSLLHDIRSQYINSASATIFTGPSPVNTLNTTGFKTQLAISILLGGSSFLAFCYFRTRWTVLFAPRTKLRRHRPPILTSTYFGWIRQLLNIEESVILDCVGLDAVMMLRFFTMSFKLFGTCLVPGILIILPINYLSTTEDGRLPTDTDDDSDYELSMQNLIPPQQGMTLLYLFTQFTFTWLFSLLTIYLLWETYEGYIKVRRSYLIKRRKATANRSIMVIGLPVHLQTDRALATFYESLGVGTVESAHVGRHVTSLQRLIEQRAHALRVLEATYTSYYGNPSSKPDYDPEAITIENDRSLDHNHQGGFGIGGEDYPPYSASSAGLVDKAKTRKRPTIRLGFMGLFGKEVDKINHYREVFATLDKAVQKLRLSRVFASTSIGFVTFEEMNSAQILAQTVNTEETLTCETFLAPEPRDVYWDNLDLPPSELQVRTVVINAIVFFLIFFWAGPVSVFSSFLNLDSLNKIFPGISKLAAKNRLIRSLIQGFLPTVGVIVFLAIVPRILLALCRRQGLRSHSEIAQSLYHKYFTFILCNIVLVFTVVGTLAQAVNKVYHNIGELTLLLAISLPRVAPFFVNYTILRGIGMFPLQLLQTADVFGLIIQRFTAKTPRDYAEARAPPELPYGVVYANSTLLFVVILIYSCINPTILIFGVIYFALAYFVYKYQLLYVYFHPNESGGQIWPMVYSRMTMGLIIFQLTMLGFFMLKHAYIFGIFLAPLPAGTFYFWIWTTETYKSTAKFMPLQILRTDKKNNSFGGPEGPEEDTHDEDPDFFHEGTYGSSNTLGSGIPSSGTEFEHITLDLDGQASKHAPRTNSIVVTGANIISTSGSVKRRPPKSTTVYKDNYQAIPDRYTDYQQPPMTLYPGVLNSGLRRYCHPALAGPLPTLWLPLKKRESSVRPEDDVIVLPNEGAGFEAIEGLENGLSSALRVTDEPRTFDEGDNLAGGGQDEDLDGRPQIGDDDCAETQVDNSIVVPQVADRVFSILSESDYESDSDITGGPTPPSGLPPVEDEQVQLSSSAPKKNMAVDGITHVYYHHPERRLSKVGSTTSLRLPKTLQHRASRTSLLREQSSSYNPPYIGINR